MTIKRKHVIEGLINGLDHLRDLHMSNVTDSVQMYALSQLIDLAASNLDEDDLVVIFMDVFCSQVVTDDDMALDYTTPEQIQLLITELNKELDGETD